MDQAKLVAAGEQLAANLVSRGIRVTIGAWVQEADGRWHLIIATPQLSTQGPLEVAKTIEDILSKIPLGFTPIVAVISPDDPFVEKIRALPPVSVPQQIIPSSSVSSDASAVTIGPVMTYTTWFAPGKKKAG